MTTILQARGLQKAYDKLQAVENVSLEIVAGETFGLLGPNGAGKSTTINMLAGLLSSDQGQITIAGRTPAAPDFHAQIGIAPQALSVYEAMSAEENLSFFGGLYGLKGQPLKRRVQQMLDLAQLEERRNDRVETYSGGMKRRLNIAVALVHQPQILLLDEPTVGVDPQSRNHILDWIADLASQGLTVLYTTHYMEEAERLCDRIGIMDHGKLLTSGSLDELLKQHTHGSIVSFESNRAEEIAQQDLTIFNLKVEQQSVRFQTHAPAEVLAHLGQSDFPIDRLVVRPPALENVFLNLTGRSLRD